MYFYHLLRAVRPRQWVKNIAVAAPLVFSGNLFVVEKVWLTIWAMIAFILVSSSIYLFNDVMDIEADRRHPFKKFRPIAAGKLPVSHAIVWALIFSGAALMVSVSLGWFFFFVVLAYVVLQVAYSVRLKHIVIIDLFVIAFGFVLRIYGGSLAINAHMSIWFLLCVITVAMMIAVGKRRAELSVMDDKADKHRRVLSRYPEDLLNSYASIFAAASILAWSLFTFFAPPPPIVQTYPTLFANLPTALAGHNKWLMLTVPIVMYGIMRYQKIIFDGAQAESPTHVMTKDKPLLLAVMLWMLLVVFILYVFPSLGFFVNFNELFEV